LEAKRFSISLLTHKWELPELHRYLRFTPIKIINHFNFGDRYFSIITKFPKIRVSGIEPEAQGHEPCGLPLSPYPVNIGVDRIELSSKLCKSPIMPLDHTPKYFKHVPSLSFKKNIELLSGTSILTPKV
jgi:hypothetical protein